MIKTVTGVELVQTNDGEKKFETTFKIEVDNKDFTIKNKKTNISYKIPKKDILN